MRYAARTLALDTPITWSELTQDIPTLYSVICMLNTSTVPTINHTTPVSATYQVIRKQGKKVNRNLNQ